MKIHIELDAREEFVSGVTCTVSNRKPESEATAAEINQEPNLYPGLKDLNNPSSKEIVAHVLNNPPRVQWYLEKSATADIEPVDDKSKAEKA